MDNLLSKQTLSLTQKVVVHQEECAVGGEYTLPEYCPDVATILKCMLHPRILNRQQSGDQLLIDGEACVRALYLDEERKCVRCVEFVLPFSCGVRGIAPEGMSVPMLRLTTKYVNCRGVTPRRLEVRGAVVMEAQVDETATCEVMMPVTADDLFCKGHQIDYTCAVGAVERVLSINEALVFPDNLPPAEMLLGGECRCVVKECKLLKGKAIVKGEVYVHQLYTDDVKCGNTYPLDYVIPFSQILDLDDVNETHRFTAQVLILSDTERCGVGQDGASNVLEFSAKLLVRLLVYQQDIATMVEDTYHTQCPMDVRCEEVSVCEHKGMRFEETMLPLKVELPERDVTDIVDVWVNPQAISTYVDGGLAHINGRLLVSVLYRDSNGCICFCEQAEEFHIEYPFECDSLMADLCVTNLRYRRLEHCLELQVGVWVSLQGIKKNSCTAVCDAKICADTPYTARRSAAMVYYADMGETVWDIGKRCHASPETICKENNINREVLDNAAVLIVPMI